MGSKPHLGHAGTSRPVGRPPDCNDGEEDKGQERERHRFGETKAEVKRLDRELARFERQLALPTLIGEIGKFHGGAPLHRNALGLPQRSCIRTNEADSCHNQERRDCRC
ncbi:hypothetical protein [Microbacterium sp. NPDC087589]|uniref:hypothetical protein n=1 Tax=Microbacterium sp. NPDC087589 TaxID=3364191 RepID=UPI00380A3E2A